MRTASGLSIVAGCFFIIHCSGCVAYLASAEQEFRQQVDARGLGELFLETRNGSIEVDCAPSATNVDIAAVKFASGMTTDDARKQLEHIQITAARDAARPERLRVTAEWPKNGGGRNRGARFRVTLPPATALTLRTSNGRVNVAGATRDVDIDTSNGAITTRDTTGALKAVTSNGKVLVQRARGNVDVRTSNGRVEMDQCGAEWVRAVSSNGSVRIANGTGNAAVRTSNGAVELQLTAAPRNPDISVTSSNGHVTVEVPADTGATLRLRSSNGGVHADLANATPMRDLDVGRNHLRATMNDGGGRIEVESSNGKVTFRTRPAASRG